MPCYSYIATLVNLKSLLTHRVSSSDSNYVPNEHDDVDQYDPYAIPFEVMPCKSYPESLKWNACWLNDSLKSKGILTNMAHLQYHLR